MTEEAAIDGQAAGNTALLIVDMINDLSFDGGDALAPRALRSPALSPACARRPRDLVCLSSM